MKEKVNVEDAAKVVWKDHKNYWMAVRRNVRKKVDTDSDLQQLGRCVDDIYTPLCLLVLKLGELSHRDKRSREILSNYDFTQLRNKMLLSTQQSAAEAIAQLQLKIDLIQEEQARIEESLRVCLV